MKKWNDQMEHRFRLNYVQSQQHGEQQDFYFDLKGQMVKIGDTLYIRYKESKREQIRKCL